MAEMTDEIGLDQLLNMGIGTSSCSSSGNDESEVPSKRTEYNEKRY